MASTDMIRDAVDAASDQRYPGTSAQPARFALVLNALDDPVARAQAIAGVLEPVGATIEPLSTLDRGVLVATFPDRAFGGPNGAAFAAAHRFQEVFDLEAAEPDLPTDLFPDDIVPDEFVEEDAEGFPAECWAPAEASLPAAWAITSITAPEAWTFSQATQRPARGTGTIVAQPDTGITAHAELADISVVPGFDVLDNDADPTDPLDGANPGHGTATASVVVSGLAGTVTGSAPGASLMAIRAVESVFRITQVSVARAIDWRSTTAPT
jgi:serine protease